MTMTQAMQLAAAQRRKSKPLDVTCYDPAAELAARAQAEAAKAAGMGSLVWRVTLPLPPTTNNLYATFRGRRIKSRAARAYKQAAGAILARDFSGAPIAAPVVVTLDVFTPTRAGDVDGRIKACLDAMSGIVYRDDRQVWRITVTKRVDKTNPRVEVFLEVGGAA